MADNLQEYVIKLGTQIDNQGVTKIFSLLDSGKLRALGITAAITAATTAVYKFIESATKQELELQKLAEKQKKTVETTRASETALKQMGMTLKEIQKDKALKSIYDDLVKFNSSLALPDMKDAIESINGLRGAFWKLKGAVQYAVQWINARVLANLAEPIERITNKLSEAANWIRDNLTSITSKISSYITGFAKGVIGIVEGFEKIVGFVNDLPDGVKRIGSAISIVFALLKSGPIGQILTVITAIGGLIDDYENFKWNKANPGETPVDIAFPGIWEILEGGDSAEEKISKVTQKLFGGITEGLNTAFQGFSMESIFSGSGDNPGLISKATDWLRTNQDTLTDFGEALVGFASRAIATVGGVAGGALGKIIDAIIGDGTVDPSLYEGDGSAAATFVGSIGTFVSNALERAKKGGSLSEALKAGFTGGIFGAIVTAIASNIKVDENGLQIEWNEVVDDLEAVGKTFMGLVTSAIGAVKDIGGVVFTAIANGLNSWGKENGQNKNAFGALGDAFEALGSENSVLGGIISTGIAGWFATGSFVGGLIAAIGDAIDTVAKDPSKMSQLQEDIEKFGNGLLGFLFGDGENNQGILGTIINVFSNLWSKIEPYLDPIKEGLTSFFQTLAEQIGNSLAPLFEVILFKLNHAFVNSDLGTALKALGIVSGDEGSQLAVDEMGRITTLSSMSNGSYGYFDKNGKWKQPGFMDIVNARGAALNDPYLMLLEKSGLFDRATGGLKGDISIKDGEIVGGNDYYDALMQARSAGDMGAFKSILSILSSLPSAMGTNEGFWANYGQLGDILNNIKETKPDTSNFDSSLNTSASQVSDMGSAASETAAKLREISVPVVEKAFGGRIGSEQNNVTVGEDGAEYIIPITKPNRAFPLINNMLREMGTSAINRVVKGLGIEERRFAEGGRVGSISSALASASSMISSSNTSNMYNVSAPVSIVVNSNGGDGETVGRTVYDSAASHLMQTIRGLFNG